MSMVTSHDVALLAGVSQPTVSRALRNHPGVAAATRERVRRAAEALGYVPNEAARAFSTRRTGRVGVVSAELNNPFYPALLEPLTEKLHERGYGIILLTDRGDGLWDSDVLVNGSLDGVILTTTMRSSRLPQRLAQRGVPFVFLGRTGDGVSADASVANNRRGAAMVAELLAQLGHRRIAMIMGPEATSTGQERAEGFRDRLAELGIPLPPKLVRRGPFAEETGRQGLISLKDSGDLPTAIFCGNDVIAIGARNGAEILRLSVPEQLTIIGFDDIPMAEWEVLNLTTMRFDFEDLAAQAVELLISRITGSRREAEIRVVQPTLVLRGTHAGPPG